MYDITECFTSIQGEGLTAGMYTSFVRFATCNFDCEWCDTPYALATQNERAKLRSEKMSHGDIVMYVAREESPAVCLTGGEPMVQKPIKLAEEFSDMDKYVSVETNGSIFVEEMLSSVSLWSLSPKLKSAKTVHWSEHDEEVKKFLDVWNGSNVQIKLVVGSDEDIMDAESFVKEFYIEEAGIPFYLMPVFNVWKGKDIMKAWNFENFPSTRISVQQHKYMAVR